MDFVTGLPASDFKTVILTIIDHFSKMAHFVALPRLCGVRQDIVSDGVALIHLSVLEGVPLVQNLSEALPLQLVLSSLPTTPILWRPPVSPYSSVSTDISHHSSLHWRHCSWFPQPMLWSMAWVAFLRTKYGWFDNCHRTHTSILGMPEGLALHV